MVHDILWLSAETDTEHNRFQGGGRWGCDFRPCHGVLCVALKHSPASRPPFPKVRLPQNRSRQHYRHLPMHPLAPICTPGPDPRRQAKADSHDPPFALFAPALPPTPRPRPWPPQAPLSLRGPDPALCPSPPSSPPRPPALRPGRPQTQASEGVAGCMRRSTAPRGRTTEWEEHFPAGPAAGSQQTELGPNPGRAGGGLRAGAHLPQTPGNARPASV